jgi:hypothetical protein
MFRTAVRFPPCCCRDPPHGRLSVSAVSVGGGQTFVPPADVVLSFRAESPAGDVRSICVLPDEGVLRVDARGAVRVFVAYAETEEDPGSESAAVVVSVIPPALVVPDPSVRFTPTGVYPPWTCESCSCWTSVSTPPVSSVPVWNVVPWTPAFTAVIVI